MEHPEPTPSTSKTQTARSSGPVRAVGMFVRLLLPLAILGVGVFAFWKFSQELEKPKTPPAEAKLIRTQVKELSEQDYKVYIKTNGVVQAHNEVALSAQVAGQVTKVNSIFEVGSYFSEGDVLVELDDRDYRTAVAMAEAQKLGAEAALQLADETFERNENLYNKKGVSEAVYKQSVAAKSQAEASLESTISQLERAERDLKRTKIVAPFDGRVRTKTVGVGQQLGAGTPLGIVFAIDYAEVRLPVSSRERQFLELPEMQSDPPVDVTLRDGINSDDPTVWSARIVRTEGALDADSLVLFAIARIDDPFGRKSGNPPLRIGQPIVASISGKTLEGVVQVPRIAVRQLDQVFLVNKDELTLKNHKIKPIWTDEESLIVRDPEIPDGQWIATTRIVHAPDGAKIEVIKDLSGDNAGDQFTDSSSDKNKTTLTKPVSKKPNS